MPIRILALTFLACLPLAYGCVTPKADPDAPQKNSSGATPGTASAEDEEWSKLGRQMRGDHPVEDQTFDPLRDIMSSPKAQSIERSLGVDN